MRRDTHPRKSASRNRQGNPFEVLPQITRRLDLTAANRVGAAQHVNGIHPARTAHMARIDCLILHLHVRVAQKSPR